MHDGRGAHDRVEAVGRQAVCEHKDRRHLLPKRQHVLRAAMRDLSSGIWHHGRLLASTIHVEPSSHELAKDAIKLSP